MNITDFGNWKILGIISIIALLLSWRNRNAIWGGFSGGIFIGLIIAIFYLIKGDAFDSKIIGKGAIVGTLCGIFAEILAGISNILKKK